jgi:hypothetical protein
VINDLRSSDPVSVGKYQLLGRLGAGGMGQVYLARSPGGRQVAIKVIRPEYAEDLEFRARFRREVTAARNVSGMFTAAVVDAQPDGPQPWMATTYVPGPSLGEAVGEKGPLPAESVFALAAGLAEGLDAIREAGLVHRDLKPSNVLLSSDGPRVIDFGISHAREGSALTQTSTVMGTPGYMSPEQARGLVVGPPSDVFSLGAVLTFAATGEGPFGAGPVHAMIYRVVHEPADLSRVPDVLRSLIEWCLAKAPEDRPTTGELLSELGPRVSEITGSWLPEKVSDTLSRYVRTIPNPVPPPTPAAAEPAAADVVPEKVAAIAVAEAPAVGLATAGVGGGASAPATAPAGVAVAGFADADTHNMLVSGLVASEEAEIGSRAAGLATAEPGAGPAEPVAPEAATEPAGDDGAGPVVPRKTRGGGRWPLTAAAVAAAGVLAAVALVLGLSPSGPPKVSGGPTPYVSDVTSLPATPSHTPSRTPTPKPKPKASRTQRAARSHPSVPKASVSATTPSAAQTTSQQAPTTAPAQSTTSPPAQKTPPPSGPQTISSAYGVDEINCDRYGSIGSASGGSTVAFSFVNDSTAGIQVWYLASSGTGSLAASVSPGQPFSPSVATGQDWMVANSDGGCMEIFDITASGQVVAS